MKARSKVNAFLYKHRNKGIPNLMLYVGIGNLVVYLLFLMQKTNPLFYSLLCFNDTGVLNGEVWRIFTYPLVYLVESYPFLGMLSLLFFFWCGRTLEQHWGTLRFNLYYFGAVLLTALVALVTRSYAYSDYINLSLILGMAVLAPDDYVMLYFVIPIKMKWLAWLELGYTLYGTVRGLIFMFQTLGSGFLYFGWLVPLVPFFLFLLFAGKQAADLLPNALRRAPARAKWQRKVNSGPVRPVAAQPQARFRCTVCGRTELTDPKLEFRYCSKCKGYRCYCEDHIHNHAHITE